MKHNQKLDLARNFDVETVRRRDDVVQMGSLTASSSDKEPKQMAASDDHASAHTGRELPRFDLKR